MALQLRQLQMSALGELRFETLQTRLRGDIGGRFVVDSTAALLVWEPERFLPSYAVPAEHVLGDLVAAAGASDAHAPADEPSAFEPRSAFSVHTAAGTRLDIRAGGDVLTDAAFRFADPTLNGVVALDFVAFDRWLEEDDEVVGHPRDPFHRIDVRPTSRRVELRFGGQILAESQSVHMVTETMMPVRYYFPSDDVRLDLMSPSDTSSTCAYKGHAAYYSVADSPDGDDIAWTYPAPLHDAQLVAGEIAFLNERVDIFVDGAQQRGPATR